MTASLFNPSPFDAALDAAFAARPAKTATQTAAFERFARGRFPHRRVEGWKWSDFSAALRPFVPVNAASHAPTPTPADLAGLKPLEFRILDGRLELPLEAAPEGVRYGIIESVESVPELETHSIVSLNIAMTNNALSLELGEGVKLARPVLIRHIISGAGTAFTQTLLRLGAGAQAAVVETYEGDGAGFYSHLCQLTLGAGASLQRAVIQDCGPDAVFHAVLAAGLESAAHYHQTSLSTGGRLSRHETHLRLLAAAASATINSAALVDGRRHCDFTSEVRHIGVGCKTRQRHKGVARDRGRNVFQGKFHVMRSAQKTDAQMNADALLLSETAEANHKPELEIYADDVQCAHGSTAGALDENAIFYMRQRGLDERAARALLIEAFIAEIFDDIAHPGIAQAFHRRVANWLEGV